MQEWRERRDATQLGGGSQQFLAFGPSVFVPPNQRKPQKDEWNARKERNQSILYSEYKARELPSLLLY